MRKRDLKPFGWALAVVIFSFARCASAASASDSRLEFLPRSNGAVPTIAVLPVNIQYRQWSLAGDYQILDDKTTMARENFIKGLQSFTSSHNANFVFLPEEAREYEPEAQYLTLSVTVGNAITDYHLAGKSLKTKRGAMDWTLGPGVSYIGEKYAADYALFVFFRDDTVSLKTVASAATGGAALAVVSPLMGGVAVGAMMKNGGEYGHAMLVSLETGDVIWCRTVIQGIGELTDESWYQMTVSQLIGDLPRVYEN